MANGHEQRDKIWGAVLQREHVAIGLRRKRLGRAAVTRLQAAEDKAYGASGSFDASGLALSGGGIRSAAFCLGAVQALAEHQLIGKIDYISTVSGGGYTGAAMTAAMNEGGVFPYQGPKEDLRDPPALGHLRDHSNYLLPRGKRSLAEDIVIVLRGLVTNVLFVLPVLLIGAALTVLLNPTVESLGQPALVVPLFADRFAVTSMLATIAFVLYGAWAVYRSRRKGDKSEFTGWTIKLAVVLLLLLAAVAFCEAQPAVLKYIHEKIEAAKTGGETGGAFFGTFFIVLTSAVTAISMFAKRIGEFFKVDAVADTWADTFKRFLGKAAIWLVALALPFLLWMVYLFFSYWGIVSSDGAAAQLKAFLDARLPGLLPAGLEPTRLVAIAYAVVAAMIMLLWLLLDANANSLHRLYRERLSQAFLARKNGKGELESLDLKLSKLKADAAPYHIVNTALNIQGSEEANARGRNADFFFFTRDHSGSASSGFLPTADFEKLEPALTLGTAMAISGAAVSSNMGSSSIGPMAPTLALLNLRLGFWLRNPAVKSMAGNALYLGREILSRLRPDGKYLYLTDGGHIDNTGLFELLRRRCSEIVVIDAEADPEMAFNSFVRLQRHARIDLGVRINLRWDKIAETSLKARDKGQAPARGPHCALGEIMYSNGGAGKLLYVKASLTGDENVYIRDYARRHPVFPHETTGDQFFSEEQFEVYRALGFHCVHGVYKDGERDEAEISASGAEFKGTENRELKPGDLPFTEKPEQPGKRGF